MKKDKWKESFTTYGFRWFSWCLSVTILFLPQDNKIKFCLEVSSYCSSLDAYCVVFYCLKKYMKKLLSFLFLFLVIYFSFYVWERFYYSFDKLCQYKTNVNYDYNYNFVMSPDLKVSYIKERWWWIDASWWIYPSTIMHYLPPDYQPVEEKVFAAIEDIEYDAEGNFYIITNLNRETQIYSWWARSTEYYLDIFKNWILIMSFPNSYGFWSNEYKKYTNNPSLTHKNDMERFGKFWFVWSENIFIEMVTKYSYITLWKVSIPIPWKSRTELSDYSAKGMRYTAIISNTSDYWVYNWIYTCDFKNLFFPFFLKK